MRLVVVALLVLSLFAPFSSYSVSGDYIKSENRSIGATLDQQRNPRHVVVESIDRVNGVRDPNGNVISPSGFNVVLWHTFRGSEDRFAVFVTDLSVVNRSWILSQARERRNFLRSVANSSIVETRPIPVGLIGRSEPRDDNEE